MANEEHVNAIEAIVDAIQNHVPVKVADISDDILARKILKAIEPFINTRHAPARCDELVTVGNITKECLLELKQMLCGEIHPCNDIGDVTDADIELVTRSQSEELLAAELRRERDLTAKQLSEVVDRMSDDYLTLKADNAELTARVKELAEALEEIDRKAQAGLCAGSFQGARAFHEDIRIKCAALGAKP